MSAGNAVRPLADAATATPSRAATVRVHARQPRNRLGQAWLALVLLFIYAPIVVVIGASFDPGEFAATKAFLQFPPKGFTLHWYLNIPPALWQSVWVSAQLAAAVALGAIALGVPAALALVRGHWHGRNMVATLFRSPLQIPFIVIGVAFLQFFNALAQATGLSLQTSFLGLFIAHLFVATPYVVGAAGAALVQLSPRLEEAAASLGASPWRSLRRVTLPLIAPGVLGGALFAFLTSFTDVTIALFLSPQNALTFPVWVFSSLQNDVEAALPALSSLVFVLSALTIVALQRLIGIETVLKSGGGAKS